MLNLVSRIEVASALCKVELVYKYITDQKSLLILHKISISPTKTKNYDPITNKSVRFYLNLINHPMLICNSSSFLPNKNILD